MQKSTILRITCVVLFIAICITLMWGLSYEKEHAKKEYEDGVEQIDIDSIYLTSSGIQVDFSEILISQTKETRKLIVSTQTAEVSVQLSDKLLKKLDFDFLKKTQNINYSGEGYFVVDLDNLTKSNVIQDKKKKTIVLKIDHAYLQAIEIDPDKIMIDEVKEGLLARGDIKLTVRDYNTIEKEIRDRMEAAFNTATNGQKADIVAKKMVREIYEPIIKAIDPAYTFNIEFN